MANLNSSYRFRISRIFITKCPFLIGLIFAAQIFWHASPALGQLIVAHRGASAVAPENSLSAFQLAWDEGADAIEGDFYLTADNQIVCIHDETTKRVSGVDLNVAGSTLDQLQQLDVGTWKDNRFAKERIPTLEDVLAMIPHGKQFFIEIKCGPEIIPFLKNTLLNSGVPTKQLKIISFNEEVVREAKQSLPDIEAFWLVSFKEDKEEKTWTPPVGKIIAIASQIDADGVDVKAELEVVDSNFVNQCRNAGFSLHAWTVDDPAVAWQLQQLGFDSITTNCPKYLRESLSELADSEQQILLPTGRNTVPTTVKQGVGVE